MKVRSTIFIMVVLLFIFSNNYLNAQQIQVSSSVSGVIFDTGTDNLGINVAVGTQFTITYTLSETADASLDVSAFVISNESNCTLGAIIPSIPFTATLQSSGTASMTVGVPVTVTASGAFSFDIDITNTDSDVADQNFDIAVSGTGIPGEIDIQRPAATSIADGAPDNVGNQLAGTPVTFTWTIEELAGSDLIVSAVSVGTTNNCSIALTDDPTSVTLNSGGTATETFDVEVTPTAAGAFSFEIDITSDDADEGNYDITVTGTSIVVTPVNHATDISIQPFFEWVEAATGITVSTNASYNPAVDSPEAWEIEETGLANVTTFDASTLSTTLLNNTKYYWWVEISSVWTLMGDFTTTQNVTPYLTAPVGGLQLNSPTIQLYWNTSGHVGDFRYDVYYSPTQKPTYAGDTPQLLNLDHEIAVVTDLTPGVTYYWQVRVKTADGEILGYSTVESFETYGVLTAPILLYPYDESGAYTTEPYVYWTSYYYNTVIQYRVIYSTNSHVDGSGILDTDTTQTPLDYNLYAQLAGLSAGSAYYWQVAATNDGGTTYAWSEVFSFTTPGTTGATDLLPPTPSYPTGGMTVYSSSVTFYWQPASYNSALQYQLRYSKNDNSMTGGMLTNGTSMPLTSSTFRQVAGLDGDAIYYWQVRTYTGSGFSDWSVVDNFVTDMSVLKVETPILLTPFDGDLATKLTPTLYWYVGGNPNGYTFTALYNTDGSQDVSGNLAAPSNVLGGVTTTSSFYAKFASALTDGNTYYWQIKAEKGAVTTYSTIRSFSVNVAATNTAAPEIPIPTYPVGGFVVITNDPILNWVVNTAYSNLEFEAIYSTDNALTSGVLSGVTTSTGWTTNLAININDLTPGAVYYWQVRSRLASAPFTESDYSAVQYFVVDAGAAPSMAILASPIGVTIGSEHPVLSWAIPATSTSILTYQVEISENPAMTTAQVINNVSTNNVSASLPSGKTYYWRVRSKTAEGAYSDFTGVGEFNIDADITEVESTNQLPTEFRVEQNYPNPFNPTTTIRFALPVTGKVSVKVYDLLGKEVAVLLNDELDAGSHSLTWNGQNNYGNSVSSGVYFYQVLSGENIVTKKMLLMK